MAPRFEFFFDYASPYSYLASTQVEAITKRTGAQLHWRPFLLGGVFKSTGNVPPAHNMVKAKYLFKDLQDWCSHYGLPTLKIPDDFPANSLKADRLGLVVDELGKLPEFTHAVFRRAFVEGRSISDVEILRGILRGLALDADALLAQTDHPHIKEKLLRNTTEAVERGAFGAPTFFVNEEDMYVGNDRLTFVERALVR
jgi:2-hydroxychromene-2-carboxylate isomerase